jgi:uncharacterized protein (TIGR02466 family)
VSRNIHQDSMWCTPIWSLVINDMNNDELADYMLFEKTKLPSEVKSNRGGWQSKLQKPEGIYQRLVNEITSLTQNLPLNVKEVTIEQMWFNINQQNDYNLIHNHGGRYHLSGTYYVRVPENSGRLVFRDPRPGQLLNNFMMERFDGNEIYHKNIHEGLLMIWPSYVDHFVEPNQTNNERISISFDITAK